MNKKTLLRTAAVLSISATLLYSTVSCGVADIMKMPNTTYTLEHTDVENYISVTGKVEGSNIVKVTSEVSTKVKTLNVGIGSNYLNIQQVLPFHDNRSRGMQVVGVLLTMAISTFLVFVATIFFIGVFLY